ncbi:MAG: hypothetical protein ACFE9P_01030 [Candidatus Hermodarchaeota archaeon]
MLKVKFSINHIMTVELLNLDDKSPNLIQNLWIIERTSGICIFEKNFEENRKIQFPNNLICGFLSAISMLALEVFAENINYIKFSNSKLYFKKTSNFLFIFRFQNQHPYSSQKIMNLIKDISKMFADMYDNTVQHWNRDVRQFKTFSRHLEKLL